MPAYNYIAVDSAGKRKRGSIQGDTPRQARQSLRDSGLLPVEINEVVGTQSGGELNRDKLKPEIVALFTRQLSILLGAGLPLEEALKTVAAQTESARACDVLTQLRSRVLEGLSLASALEDFPRSFSNTYRANVEAGEATGNLDLVLGGLAEHLERTYTMRGKVVGAMFYPLFMLFFSVCILVALMVLVIPKISEQYDRMGVEMMWLTQIFIDASDFINNYFMLLIIATISSVVALRIYFSKPQPKRSLHRFLLRLPFFKKFLRSLNCALFTRTLGMMLKSNVPVLEALRVSAETMGNLPMRDAVLEARGKVKEGVDINRALGAASVGNKKLFPPMTLQMIATGEKAGDLEQLLNRAADNHEREVDVGVDILSSRIGPMMIMFVGLLVGTIIVATMFPMMSLASELNKSERGSVVSTTSN